MKRQATQPSTGSLLPRSAIWAIFIVAGFAWLLQLLFIVWMRYVLAPFLDFGDLTLPHSIHVTVLVFCSAVYALYRSWWFHPVINTPYGRWLAQTPWRYPEPLPLGPLHPTWEDVLLVGAMTVIAFVPPHQSGSPLLVPVAFLLCYTVGLCIAHWRCEIRWPALACLSAAAAAMLFDSQPLATLIFLAFACCVAIAPLRRSLREFPFSSERHAVLKLLPFEPQPEIQLDWLANPVEPRRWLRVGSVEAAAVAITLGWLMFCATSRDRSLPDTSKDLLVFHVIAAAVVIVGRLAIYCLAYWPPISIAGRIATRRFIVSGYDNVFVAPLAATAVAYLAPKLLLAVGLIPVIAVPMATAATVWLALALPPRLSDWHFTGHYRLATIGVETKLTVRS